MVNTCSILYNIVSQLLLNVWNPFTLTSSLYHLYYMPVCITSKDTNLLNGHNDLLSVKVLMVRVCNVIYHVGKFLRLHGYLLRRFYHLPLTRPDVLEAIRVLREPQTWRKIEKKNKRIGKKKNCWKKKNKWWVAPQGKYCMGFISINDDTIRTSDMK